MDMVVARNCSVLAVRYCSVLSWQLDGKREVVNACGQDQTTHTHTCTSETLYKRRQSVAFAISCERRDGCDSEK